MPKELDIRQHTACVVLFFLWNSVKSIHYPVINITIKLLSLLFFDKFFYFNAVRCDLPVGEFVYIIYWLSIFCSLLSNRDFFFEKLISFLSGTWLLGTGLGWSLFLRLCNTIFYIFIFRLFPNCSWRIIIACPDFCRFNDLKSFLLFLSL